MRTYIVLVRVIGGDFKRLQIGGEPYETTDLASALCMKDASTSSIKEAAIFALDTEILEVDGCRFVNTRYELVE